MNNEIENILRILNVNNLKVIDVGASGGVWKYYRKFIGSKYVEIILVEPSAYHAQQLSMQYKESENVIVEVVGLYSETCIKELNYSNTGGASICTNSDIVEDYVEYHSNKGENIKTSVNLISSTKWIDSILKSKDLVGIKLDVQGCEMDILTAYDGFSHSGFMCIEAPFGHKYLEQSELSEYFNYLEKYTYEIYDIVINYSTYVKNGNRLKFIKNMFNLIANDTHKDSVFRPRSMDGDIYAIKAVSSDHEVNVKRFLAFITLEYYVEAYYFVDLLDLTSEDKISIKNCLKKIINKKSLLRDKWNIVKKIYNMKSNPKINKILKKIKLISDFDQ